MLQRRIGMMWTSSGWSVWTSPRANCRRERALRLMIRRDKREIIASGHGRLGRPQAPHALADLQRTREDRSHRHNAEELVTRDRGQPGRRDAAAVAAIGRAAELARRNPRRQIGGNRRRRPGENALVGAVGWI